MPVSPGELKSGEAVFMPSMKLMGQDDDSGSCRRIIRRGVQGILGFDPGGANVPDHLKCCGGSGGAPLCLDCGIGRGGTIGVGGGGAQIHLLLLRGKRFYNIDQDIVSARGDLHLYLDV